MSRKKYKPCYKLIYFKSFSEFPAITVCLDNFGFLQRKNGSLYQKCDVGVTKFIQALEQCLENEYETMTTTEQNDIFGGMFNNDEEQHHKFKSLDEFMKATRFLKIHEMIKRFEFGNQIIIDPIILTSEDREYFLQENWIETIHYHDGICYSFDYSDQNVTSNMVPIYFRKQPSRERFMTKLEIEFDVSCNLNSLNHILLSFCIQFQVH